MFSCAYWFMLVILLSLFLSGDIHLNPGPTSSTFNICTLNIRSFLNPLKYTAISDLADTHKIHVFALTETWITPSATPFELRNTTPSVFFLVSHPRIAPANHARVVGGGTRLGTWLSLLSHLPVRPSRLLNSLLSPSNFSILN